MTVEDADGQPVWPNLPLALNRLSEDTPTLRRRFLTKFLGLAKRLPFAEELAAAFYCTIDPDTPSEAKAVLAGAIAYFVLPFDLMPDMILGLGFADDASVLAAAVATVGANLKPRHRLAAQKLLSSATGRKPGRAEAAEAGGSGAEAGESA